MYILNTDKTQLFNVEKISCIGIGYDYGVCVIRAFLGSVELELERYGQDVRKAQKDLEKIIDEIFIHANDEMYILKMSDINDKQ